MRVNVYAEEMTERIEIIEKEIDGHKFTGLRFYLELPATVAGQQYQGPFIHRPGDDDSSAVTFWGKRDLRAVLKQALDALDTHYAIQGAIEGRIECKAVSVGTEHFIASIRYKPDNLFGFADALATLARQFLVHSQGTGTAGGMWGFEYSYFTSLQECESFIRAVKALWYVFDQAGVDEDSE